MIYQQIKIYYRRRHYAFCKALVFWQHSRSRSILRLFWNSGKLSIYFNTTIIRQWTGFYGQYIPDSLKNVIPKNESIFFWFRGIFSLKLENMTPFWAQKWALICARTQWFWVCSKKIAATSCYIFKIEKVSSKLPIHDHYKIMYTFDLDREIISRISRCDWLSTILRIMNWAFDWWH